MKINAAYAEGLKSRKRYLVLYGGAGSGKSYFAAQKIMLRCFSEVRHRILVLRKVARTARHSVYAQLLEVINNEHLGGRVIPYEGDLRIKFPAQHSEIITAGIDDPEKLKSITGITSIWIEEATELNYADFEEINRRLRGTQTNHYKQIILTFNGLESWVTKEFINRDDPDALVINTVAHDNVYIDDEYISKVLDRIRDPLARAIYRDGKVGQTSTPDQLIPYDLLMRALKTDRIEGERFAGGDVARFGDDDSCYCVINGNTLHSLETWHGYDTQRIAQFFRIKAEEYYVPSENNGVDGVGLGAGVIDALKENDFPVEEIIAGAAPLPESESVYQYTNLRSQMWFNVRLKLMAGELHFDKIYNTLFEDLASPRFKIRADKKIEVESKESIKKRLHRSPDEGDAYVMALFMKRIRELNIEPGFKSTDQNDEIVNVMDAYRRKRERVW
jgi:hypothetical protein